MLSCRWLGPNVWSMILLALTILFSPTLAAAVVYGTPQKISGSLTYCSNPQINDNGRVVFEGFDGNDSEIYLYTGTGSPQNISNNSWSDDNPAINNNGQVVWEAQNSTWDIFLYTGSGTPLNISYPSIGPDPVRRDFMPKINDSGWVVWDGYDSYKGYEIYLYTGTNTVKISNPYVGDFNPQINNKGWVVWTGYNGPNVEVYLYKGSGTPQDISDNSVSNGAPQINNNGKIVWESDNSGISEEIYLYNGSSPVQDISNSSSQNGSPNMNDNGWVVWQGYDGNNSEIYLYTGTGSSKNISNNALNDYGPEINDNGWVVWQGWDGNDYDIYLYTGSGTPQNISNNSTNDSNFHINNKGQIVWQGADGSIYLANPVSLTVQPDPVVNSSVATTQEQVQNTYNINECKLITPEDFGWSFNSSQETFVLIHGWLVDNDNSWSPEDDYLWDWKSGEEKNANDYYAMAAAIHQDTGANVFIWDWTRLADSSLIHGPPIQNEQASANYLENVLTSYFTHHSGYDEPVQFVGHSMGGKVALLSANSLEQHGFDITQVSLLDPYNCEDILNNLNQTHNRDFYIDQYSSLVSRTYFDLSLGNYKISNCFVDGADVNVYLTDVELTGVSDIEHDHHEAVAYYMNTIPGTADYDQNLQGGFAWSIAGTTCPLDQFYFTHSNGSGFQATTHELYQAKAIADTIRDALKLGNSISNIFDNLSEEDLSVLNFNASLPSTTIEWLNNWRVKLKTGSPSYVYQRLSLPEHAEYITANYTIDRADNDSYIAVLVNDDLLYYAPAGLNLGRTMDSGHLDISKYAGQTVNLTFLVDDPDSTGGSTVYLNNMQILEACSYNPYEFTFTSDSADTLTGTVYAATDEGYYPGLSWAGSEGSQAGTYEITGVGPGSSDYAGKIGQVFIVSYHDAATGLDYTPLEYTQGLPSGTDYLESEQFRGGIAQVTDNSGYFDVAPQVLDDGRILWQGWDGHDYEIYCLVPGQGITQLTNNDTPDAMPQMNASGQAVWMNWDGQDWEVWYNLGSGPVQLTNNAGAFDVLPQITADAQVYWQGWDGHDYEIYHYNTATRATTQLTDNALPDAAPEVNASGQLTWMGQDGSNWQVYYNTGNGPVQLTTSGANLSPQITDAGQLFWQGWDGSDYEIYRYTIGSGPTENLTNNMVNDMTPAVKNGVLVWSQWDGSYWQIYQDFLSTGLVTQITDDDYDNKSPRVNGNGQIVWQKWDGSDFEVYAYK